METPNEARPSEPALSSGVALLAGAFLCASASAGPLLYVLSQSVQPVIESAGFDGCWLDIFLFLGGLAALWRILSPPGTPQANESAAANAPLPAPAKS